MSSLTQTEEEPLVIDSTTRARSGSRMRRIKMILPVPLPRAALDAFAAQLPATLIRPDLQVEFVGTRAGATILDSYYETALAEAFCIEAGVRAEAEGFDAVCLNSMSDSGLQ